MVDQAENLRNLMDEPGPTNSQEVDQRNGSAETIEEQENRAEVLTVTSGKGGVGKSNLSVNLGIAMSQSGYDVAVADMDLGLANVNVITDCSPRHNLMDVFKGRKQISEIMESAPGDIDIIAGASGKEELANLSRNDCRSIVRQLGELDEAIDVLIVDTAAGLSDRVMQFVTASDRTLLVSTPEPTAITDAYAIIKAGKERTDNAPFNLVINRASSILEAKRVAEKMQRVGNEFLNVPIEILGFMTEDEKVAKSVRNRAPFYLEYPNSKVSQCIKHISDRLMSDRELQQPNGIKNFFGNVFSWF